MDTQKAIQFIERTGRPIEQAQLSCQYGGGPAGDIVPALLPFQNPDGGFGHALEPDNWNPHSTPITTNTALGILYETGALDFGSDMAQGMARYLRSAADKETGLWPATLESNKDYPHAIWWESPDSFPIWNPGVSLAAFLVCMGEDSYRETVRRAFKELPEIRSGDALKCFMLAYNLLKKAGIPDVLDFDEAYRALQGCVWEAVCKDISKYGVEYVTTPSSFPKEFVPERLRPQVEAELGILGGQQLPDGGFDITWKWHTPYEREFATARDWWRPRVTMEKLLFHKAWAASLSE